MTTDAELLDRVFPVYLSDASKKHLADCFADRATNHDYHAGSWEGPDQPIQGDGWRPLALFDFDSGERRIVSGIVLSNSCDIDRENDSMRPRSILFAPLMKLADYATLLSTHGIAPERVEAHLRTVRRQEKTEIFYIPPYGDLPESLAMLDDLHSQPLMAFLGENASRKRLFRLNNFGFYMFLMKLSIHFTRFGEKLDRSNG